MPEVNKHYREVKTVLRKAILPDSYFVGKYSFSPYQACEHGCKYCDGRAEKYYVEGDFDRDIVIRKNLPQILERELSRIREKGIIMIGSGISDPYQPVEKEEMLMSESAKIIAKYKLPASVMTKSNLISRDIDIWQKVNKDAGFTLMVSLTFTDDVQRKIFEPYSSSVQERLDTLQRFKEKGCFIGVIAMPFLPYITDTEENIEQLFKEAKRINADFVKPEGLTLRPGRQKDLYMDIIKNYYPELVSKYEALYIENRPSGAPIFEYRQELHKRFNKIIDNYKISTEVPHYIYNSRFPIYDELYIVLNHLINFSTKLNIPQTTIKNSLAKYTNWLIAEKQIFNRKRKMAAKELEDKLLVLMKSQEFSKIFPNPKLARIARAAVLESKTFLNTAHLNTHHTKKN